jgi:hypothetical protein
LAISQNLRVELVIQTGPAKALRRMPKADAEALLGRLKRIAADPFGSPLM